jgi:hypothetical protein
MLAAVALTPAAQVQPHVQLAGFAPATVAGRGFHADERVVVKVHGTTFSLSKVVSTSTRGAFVARFTRDRARSPCDQIAITAVGSRGDHAAWKTPPAVCGTQQQPVGQ